MTATATKPKSAMSMIKGLAKPKAAAKKDEKPVLFAPELEATVKSYVNYITAAKSNQTLADMTKDQLTAEGRKFLMEESSRSGRTISSITIQAGPTSLTCTLPCQYSPVNPDDRPLLESVYGEDTDSYFKDRVEIKLKEESMTEEIMTKLLESLGEDFFSQHFDIKNSIKVTELFHTKLITDPAFREQSQGLLETQKVKPYSASLKL